jgi:putative endonuclease
MTRALRKRRRNTGRAVRLRKRKRGRARLSGKKSSKPGSIRRKIIRKGRFFVYIVECSDGSYYTGYTKDLAARLKLHNSGRGSKYVRGKRPVQLVFSKKYRYYKHAVREERRIKTLTRKQKQKLMAGYRRA